MDRAVIRTGQQGCSDFFTHSQTEKQTNRQTDRQTYRETTFYFYINNYDIT